MWEPKAYKTQEFIWLIKGLIEMYGVDTYVEVGVQAGICISQIAPFVKRPVGVDILSKHRRIPTNVGYYKMTSEEFAVEWAKQEDPTIDLLFIDADHSKEAVLNDFKNIGKFVRPQTGFVLLHDTYPATPELATPAFCGTAWQAARHIHKKMKDWEIVTWPGPYAGISICRHVPNGKHLHWDKTA